MKRFSKLLITSLLAVTTTMSFMACGTKASKDNNSENMLDDKNISGTVRYLTHANHEEHTRKLIEEFNKVYPNITIDLEFVQGDVSTDLTSKAATQDLPDVVVGYGTDLLYAISQGWAEPVNKYVENDPDYKYVPKSTIINEVGGKTYGLPYNASTTGIVVNLDLLESLNMDVPEYTWTVTEFLEMAKKATTDKYSGIDNIPYVYEFMMGNFSKDLTHWGYNASTNKFNFTDGGFQKLTSFVKQLKEVPGLLANSLINDKLREEGKLDDYQKKFGKDVNAFVDGKVLFANMGLWNLDWLKLNFNYDFYPYPTDPEVGYKQGVGVDQPFMTIAAKNKDASFLWLKWITYSPQGIKAEYEIRKTEENPIPKILIPPTTHPEVIEIYNNLETVPNGIKYIFKNLDKTFSKSTSELPTPNFGNIANEILNPKFRDITNGKIDGAAIASELETQANNALDEAREKFEKEVGENITK